MQRWDVLDGEQMLLGAGGNLDNRRIGIGASMYYPVSVDGALLSMGDAHSAQGDSEFDGQSHVCTSTCTQACMHATHLLHHCNMEEWSLPDFSKAYVRCALC